MIEAVVSLLVAALIFGALALTITAGLRASMTGRQDQQAADFMTRQVERARTTSFASLAMSASDPALSAAQDSAIVNCSPSLCVDPGTGVTEKLHVVPTGAWLASHTETLQSTQSNNTAYRVRSYVTELAGQDPTQTLRFTVFVDYKAGSTPRSKSISTVISKVQRGLPLPIFKLTATTPVALTVNPGARLTYGFQLVNQGAPDRWNISLSGSASTLAWQLYQDVDADGFYDVGTDPLLTDSSSDGIVDSGRLDPNGSMSFVAVYDTTVADTLGSRTLTVTATSVAQPSASGASHAVTVTATIQIGAVSSSTTTTATTTPPPTPASDCNTATAPALTGASGYTLTGFSLHNSSGPPGGPTTAVGQLPMTRDGATYGSTLSAYSTNLSSAPGRTLMPAGSLTPAQIMALTDTSKYVDWSFTTGGKGAVSAPAQLKVWVGGQDGGVLASGTVQAVVYEKKTSTTVLGSGTAPVSGCAGFSKSFVSVAGTTAVTFNKNEVYGVRLINVGTTPVQMAYDTPTYPASLTLGVK